MNDNINSNKKQLSAAVSIIPEDIIAEVKAIMLLMFDDFNIDRLEQIFIDIVGLFEGQYPGYQACNTLYHDRAHSLNTFLTMARLLHGYRLKHVPFVEKDVLLGLSSALMHDVGYIQTDDDTTGTGAKYTLTHESRSIDFAEKYLSTHGYSVADFKFCRNCILYTDMSVSIDENTISPKEVLFGKMLGMSDLLAQIADRIYLEKLVFLYLEFKEGGVVGFEDAHDLLKKTIEFYQNSIQKRFTDQLDNLNTYMIYHFNERWDSDIDVYAEAIDKNLRYLKTIIENEKRHYTDFLRRDGIISSIEEGLLD